MLKNRWVSKISIKMKNFKTSYESQVATRLKEIFQPPPPPLPPPDKSFLHLWNKNVWTEIYRNMQTFAFQVLGKCSSWASRNSVVPMFFLALTIIKFLAVLWEYIVYDVDWVEVRQMSEVFERNSIVKWVMFFARFCWLWDFLSKNLRN